MMMNMKKTSIITTSAETIGNNPDLLTQILLRLPTKPLLKFKCVSKLWLSLISNRHFCLSHTRHHQSNGFLSPTALLLKWEPTLPAEFDVVPLKLPFFDYMNYARNINVLQSYYGLFLCGSVVDTRDFRDEYVISRYFICNHTTKKYKEVSFPIEPFQGSKFYVSMAFDPLKSPHCKIIRVHEVCDRSFKYELDIYSSETDCWSLSTAKFNAEHYIKFEDAIYCNGKIHWKSYFGDVLYFDVENKSVKQLPIPISTMEAPEKRRFFGECRGVLYPAQMYSMLECSEFDVFEMESDYSHWVPKHRLDILVAVKDPEIILSDPLDTSSGFCDVCITHFEKEEPKVVV